MSKKDYMDLDQYEDADWERLSRATHYSPERGGLSFETAVAWVLIVVLSIIFWVVVIGLMTMWGSG